jgi:heat shock protein HtpX
LSASLLRIERAVKRIPNEEAEEVPATAHMFIINPLTGQGMDNLFSTHPNTENRVAALEQFAQELERDGYKLGPMAQDGDRRGSGGEGGSGPWSGPAERDERGPWS